MRVKQKVIGYKYNIYQSQVSYIKLNKQLKIKEDI